MKYLNIYNALTKLIDGVELDDKDEYILNALNLDMSSRKYKDLYTRDSTGSYFVAKILRNQVIAAESKRGSNERVH